MRAAASSGRPRCTRRGTRPSHARLRRPARAGAAHSRSIVATGSRLPRTSGTQPSARLGDAAQRRIGHASMRIGIERAGRGSVIISTPAENSLPSTPTSGRPCATADVDPLVEPLPGWSRTAHRGRRTPQPSSRRRSRRSPVRRTERRCWRAARQDERVTQPGQQHRRADLTRSVTVAIAAHHTMASYHGSFGSHLICRRRRTGTAS